jgi:hypothetical protein
MMAMFKTVGAGLCRPALYGVVVGIGCVFVIGVALVLAFCLCMAAGLLVATFGLDTSIADGLGLGFTLFLEVLAFLVNL